MDVNSTRRQLAVVQAPVGRGQTDNTPSMRNTRRRLPILTPLLESIHYGTSHLSYMGVKANQQAAQESLLPSRQRLAASFSAVPGRHRDADLGECGLDLNGGGIPYFLSEYDKNPDKLNPVSLRVLYRAYVIFSGIPMVCPTDTAKALKKRMLVVHTDKTAHLQERPEWNREEKMHSAICRVGFRKLFFVLERLHSMLDDRAFTDALYAPGRKDYGRLRWFQEGVPCLAGATVGLSAFFFGRSTPLR
jgi:hypothetical protein